jgi:hypothetical protein
LIQEIVIFWALLQRLMGVPEELMDDFADTYMDTMHRTLDYPISRTGEELRSLAIEML